MCVGSSCVLFRFALPDALADHFVADSLSAGKVTLECCAPYRVAFVASIDHSFPGGALVVNLALAEGRPERLLGLIADLVPAKVDVIVITSTHETLAAKKATSIIPIVMTLAPDPVERALLGAWRDRAAT